MSASCPACGVAVVPGYVRCPKCHAGLPGRTKCTTADPGGTAVVQRGFPIAAVLVAIGVAGAVILLFGMRGRTQEIEAAPPAPPGPIEVVGQPPPSRPLAPPAPAASATAPPAAPDPAATAADIEDALRRQRLWGRVVITGPRIDVRSGSCADPAMAPLIEGKKALLLGAGLTKLRCLEQSGAVVFERDF